MFTPRLGHMKWIKQRNKWINDFEYTDCSRPTPPLAACDWQLCPLPPKAAKIPLSTELGIDEFHFNDFSLDNDAMITASLRMFLELGVVQKFKIDYEVRTFETIDK